MRFFPSCDKLILILTHSYMQERPEKPDVPWLTTATWNLCCDLEDILPVFKGLTSDLIATPVHCKAGRVEVSHSIQ